MSNDTPDPSQNGQTPETKKPDLPPGLGKENEESEEPGAKKPVGPPSPGSDEDGSDGGPTLPPGYGGDGGGDALSREDFQ